MSLLTTALAGVATGGSSVLAGLLPYAIAAAVGLGGGVFVTHKWDQGSYQKLQASIASERAAAAAAALKLQQSYDNDAIAAAQREYAVQQAIAKDAQRRLAEVKRHVSVVPHHCVTWGLVRVLDAAALGVDADTLSLPSGKSDDACTGVTDLVLAQGVGQAYSVCRANGEQLGSLIGFIRDAKAHHDAKR